ncbi:MAG: prepilin-type N-terminal cleavage/methylation domain-containing protein, partial [Candidatus Omnitrophica bacterium]|nr:prepilin-type N-terminal cleavage/methylation domain-containing protein [Candidatus Omnitrophota bacterium]
MKKQIMKRFLKDKKGFTFIEVMFVALISLMVIGAILAGWIFTYRTWTSETERTNLRVDIMKALETLKKDTRLSSLTYMSFYPAGAGPYSAVSLPVAVTDMNGFFSLNASGEIDWDKTVIYHLYTGAGGGTVMRRTVFDPRDNTMTDDERYAQLAGVVSSGTGSGGSTTDTEFLENVDTFGISSLSPIIDFYDESSTPVKVGKIVFGWVKLGPGDHTVRFEITGKNDLSSGYDIGIDKILIEPSGSSREAEYYNSSFAPSGALTLSGGAANRVHGTMWDNDNYLEFVAGGTGNYMEISDHYDLWRESAFDSSSLNNVEKAEEEVRMTLDTPLEGEEGEITWFAYSEAGDSQQEGRDGTLPGGVTPPVTVRTAVTQNNIDEQGDLIRVSFRSGSDTALTIDKAYITKRTGASGA